MPKECAAPDCHEKKGKDSKYSFHQFPKDRALRREWVIRIKRLDPKTKKLWEPKEWDTLCSKHFVDECFTTRTRMSKQLGFPFLAQLLPDAIPTIFQHNEIARKRKKDLSDRRVSVARRLQHKQTINMLLTSESSGEPSAVKVSQQDDKSSSSEDCCIQALNEIVSSPLVSTDTLNSSESTSKCMEANIWLSSEYTANKHPCSVKTKRPVKRLKKRMLFSSMASDTDAGFPKIFLKTIKMEDNPDNDNIGTEITVAGSEKSSTMNKLTPFIKKEPEDFNLSWSVVQTDDGFENKTEITMAGSEESSSVNKLTPFIKKEPDDFNSSWSMVQTNNNGLTPFIKKEPEDFSLSWSMVQTDNDGFENKMETKVYPTGMYCNIYFAYLKKGDRQ